MSTTDDAAAAVERLTKMAETMERRADADQRLLETMMMQHGADSELGQLLQQKANDVAADAAAIRTVLGLLEKTFRTADGAVVTRDKPLWKEWRGQMQSAIPVAFVDIDGVYIDVGACFSTRAAAEAARGQQRKDGAT